MVLVAVRVFSLKRYTAGAFAVHPSPLEVSSGFRFGIIIIVYL